MLRGEAEPESLRGLRAAVNSFLAATLRRIVLADECPRMTQQRCWLAPFRLLHPPQHTMLSGAKPCVLVLSG